jgi:hypothetical protein
MDGEVKKFQTVFAEAQPVLFIHITAASRTNEIAGPFGMLRIGSVPAYPTLVHPDVTITVINHIPETTLLTYHKFPLSLVLSPQER